MSFDREDISWFLVNFSLVQRLASTRSRVGRRFAGVKETWMKNLMKQVTSSRDRSGTVWSPSVRLSRLGPLAQKNLWFCSEHVQMLQEDLLPSGQRGRNFEEKLN